MHEPACRKEDGDGTDRCYEAMEPPENSAQLSVDVDMTDVHKISELGDDTHDNDVADNTTGPAVNMEPGDEIHAAGADGTHPQMEPVEDINGRSAAVDISAVVRTRSFFISLFVFLFFIFDLLLQCLFLYKKTTDDAVRETHILEAAVVVAGDVPSRSTGDSNHCEVHMEHYIQNK
ncbi:unnamed protein product, partial [Urochloa humidicola]